MKALVASRLSEKVVALSNSVQFSLSSVALAEPAATSVFAWSRRLERMAVLTVGASREDRSVPVATVVIFFGAHKSEMGRVHTSSSAADEVVELWDVPSKPYRNGLDEPSEQDSVHRRSDVQNACVPISGCIQGTSPEPTSRDGVNLDLREDSPDVLRLKSWDGEILRVSHARGLLGRLRDWSGPRRCFRTVSARLLYAGQGAR